MLTVLLLPPGCFINAQSRMQPISNSVLLQPDPPTTLVQGHTSLASHTVTSGIHTGNRTATTQAGGSTPGLHQSLWPILLQMHAQELGRTTHRIAPAAAAPPTPTARPPCSLRQALCCQSQPAFAASPHHDSVVLNANAPTNRCQRCSTAKQHQAFLHILCL